MTTLLLDPRPVTAAPAAALRVAAGASWLDAHAHRWLPGVRWRKQVWPDLLDQAALSRDVLALVFGKRRGQVADALGVRDLILFGFAARAWGVPAAEYAADCEDLTREWLRHTAAAWNPGDPFAPLPIPEAGL